MMFKCLTCKQKFTNEGALYAHIEKVHRDSIPKDYSPTQYQYMLRTGKTRGRCVQCGGETPWNENTQKYLRMCGRQVCKDKARAQAMKNMTGKYGVTTLLNDPEHQRKMLANRSISGEYLYAGKTKIPYTGSYEKSFLEFMDVILNHPVEDIIAPSPNTYYYMYKGEKKFYIPDFFIPSLNLEIEVKDGGSNPNNHHKIQAVDKVKEKLKDDVMKSLKNTSYIKILDKNNYTYIDFLVLARNSYNKHGEIKPIYLIEDTPKLISGDASIKMIQESVVAAYQSNDVGIIESVIDMLYENTFVYETMAIRSALESHLESLEPIEQEPNKEDSISMDIMMGLQEAADSDTIKAEKAASDATKQLEDMKKESETDLKKVESKDEIPAEEVLTESVGVELVPVYVLLTNTGTALSSLVNIANNTEYAHSSIAFEPSLRKAYSFGRKYTNNPLIGRFVTEDIKDGLYGKMAHKTHFALYVTFVSKEEKQAMEDRVKFFEDNKDSFKYNFRGLLRFKMGRKSDNVNSYFCSQFVDAILREGGEFNEGKHSSQIAPQDFATNHKFMLVSSGLLSKYNEKDTIKNTELLKKSFHSNMKPFKKPFVVYMPIEDHYSSLRTFREVLEPHDKNEDRVILTLPSNLKTLREIANAAGRGPIYEYKRYTIIPITGDVDLIDYSEDSATISVPLGIKIDNLNTL